MDIPFEPCCKDFLLWLSADPIERSVGAWHSQDCPTLAGGTIPTTRFRLLGKDSDYEFRIEQVGGVVTVYLCDYGFNNVLVLGRFGEATPAFLFAMDYCALMRQTGFSLTDLGAV